MYYAGYYVSSRTYNILEGASFLYIVYPSAHHRLRCMRLTWTMTSNGFQLHRGNGTYFGFGRPGLCHTIQVTHISDVHVISYLYCTLSRGVLFTLSVSNFMLELIHLVSQVSDSSNTYTIHLTSIFFISIFIVYKYIKIEVFYCLSPFDIKTWIRILIPTNLSICQTKRYNHALDAFFVIALPILPFIVIVTWKVGSLSSKTWANVWWMTKCPISIHFLLMNWDLSF